MPPSWFSENILYFNCVEKNLLRKEFYREKQEALGKRKTGEGEFTWIGVCFSWTQKWAKAAREGFRDDCISRRPAPAAD
jgi:hypothetical protein